MKVVYNNCYGGFGLNHKAANRYLELSGKQWEYDMDRTDPFLVQVVEEMNASDSFSDLKIEEVFPGEKWRIDEYDGLESVMTVDDYGWQIAT